VFSKHLHDDFEGHTHTHTERERERLEDPRGVCASPTLIGDRMEHLHDYGLATIMHPEMMDSACVRAASFLFLQAWRGRGEAAGNEVGR
jgi:hypothetical protein